MKRFKRNLKDVLKGLSVMAFGFFIFNIPIQFGILYGNLIYAFMTVVMIGLITITIITKEVEINFSNQLTFITTLLSSSLFLMIGIRFMFTNSSYIKIHALFMIVYSVVSLVVLFIGVDNKNQILSVFE